MANELKLQFAVDFQKPPLPTVNVSTGIFQVSVAGRNIHRTVQNVPATAPVQLDLGGATALGYATFKNLDTINFVTIQVGSAGSPFAKLMPGESAVLRLFPTVDLWAVSNSAAVDVDVVTFPD